MIKIIFIASCLCVGNLFANDDDLFSDSSVDMELDANFEDDFAAIEQDNQGSQSSADRVISGQAYDLWSVRAPMRDEQSLGLFGGNETIARVFHLSFFPQVRFHVWKLDNHLGVPLRFPVFDNIEHRHENARKHGFVSAERFITPRSNDYQSFADIQRIVRNISFGKSDQKYSLRLERDRAITLAHGDLIKEMTADALYDQDYLFAVGHGVFDSLRVDAFMGPLPLVHMLGVNARLLPFAGLNFPAFVQNTNLDLSYVGDFTAPNEAYKQEDALLLQKDRRLVDRVDGHSHGLSLGASSSFFPVNWFSATPYVSYAHLFLADVETANDASTSYGAGVHIGHDASFYLGANKQHVILFRSEIRVFSQNYQPNYFGGPYMLDRVNFIEDSLITKSQYVRLEENDSFRFGHVLELGYALDKIFHTKLSYENARPTNTGIFIQPLRKFNFINSLYAWDRIGFHVGYEATSILELGDLFDFEKSRALLSLRGQIKLMPFLYLDSWLKHSFGIKQMYKAAGSDTQWLSDAGETRSLNVGIGLELAMKF